VDGPEGGQLRLCDTEELEDPLMVVLVGVDGDEQRLALVLLSTATSSASALALRKARR